MVGAIVPAIPISAAGELYLDPVFGPIGTEVQVTAVGVGTTTTTNAYIRFDSLTSTTNQIRITLTNGGFEGNIELPDGLDGGVHTVYVYRSATDNAAAEFNITPRLTAIDPEEGQVGSTITIEGDGFVATAPSIYAYWDDVRITPVSGSTVSSSGELSNFKVAVPPTTRGEHTLRLEDRKNDNFATDDAIFSVNSKFTLSPTTGSIGDTLTLTGTGFAGGALNVLFDTQVVKSITVPTTGANAGAFTTTIVVPPTTAGAHTVKVQDTEEFEATFTVSQQFNLTPTGTPISVGDNISITGNGFPVSATIVVTLDNVPVTITPVPTTSGTGTFNVTFPAPAAAKGQHTIRVQIGSAAPVSGTIIIKEKLLSLGPVSGPPGTSVKASGTGFTPGTARVIMDGSNQIGTIVVEANGSFTDAAFTIPQATQAGSHSLSIEGITAPSFTLVPDPKITITPTSGVYADTITVTGTGFGAGKGITVVIDNAYSLATGTVDAQGNFSATFKVPNLPRGEHLIKVSDGGDKTPEGKFTINQALTIGATTGKLGDKVSLLGTGFAANRPVTVTLGGTAVTTDPGAITSDQYGSFSGFMNIPALPAGTYTVNVTDGANSATGSFTTTLAASLSPTTTNETPGWVGLDITVKGDGFKASSPIAVTVDNGTANIATGTTSAQGSFQFTFKAPAIAKGAHTIKVSDGTTSKEFQFVMEGSAPPAPLLATPATASKPVQPVAFTWNSVSDPSGVTYEFQLSQDPTFNPAKLVLEQTKLTATTLTLPADQKLPAAGGKTPYQWRVRAIDAAGNAGPWSTANTFNIGFVWPNWIIHVWYGLGIVVALILGLWLGRRMAYQSY
jgi:hypothetical protein